MKLISPRLEICPPEGTAAVRVKKQGWGDTDRNREEQASSSSASLAVSL